MSDERKKRYSVNATVIGCTHIGIFEASSPEEAIEMAESEAHISFCHQCVGNCENAECEDFTAEEVDDE